MIGLDTNVLVRYLAQEEPRQSAAATTLIRDGVDCEHAELRQPDRPLRRSGKVSKSAMADIIIAQVAQAKGCSRIVSFDKAAVRDAGMTLLT